MQKGESGIICEAENPEKKQLTVRKMKTDEAEMVLYSMSRKVKKTVEETKLDFGTGRRGAKIAMVDL